MAVWPQIVGGLVILFLITVLLQWLPPRGRARGNSRKQFWRWDVAPVVGFFGLLLLGLSLALAGQHEVIALWAWGIGFGVIVGAAVWVARRRGARPAARAAAGPWGLMRKYGKWAVVAAAGLYLSIRLVGVGLAAFVAAAMAVLVLAAAAVLFVENRPIGE